ncbi:MAG: hypothetical protein MUF59_01020 [Candidatus Krumholzibacteria bacterium]|jgi:hypothetical protein|nr:hypothetical protein [Candidatus Krumholzibacteria bacterium]
MARFWHEGMKWSVREGAELHVNTEVTVFMQKAIYYVSRLMAARGVVEMTDRSLNFEVSSLDSAFGIRDVSIDLSTLLEVRIECGDLNPRIIVTAACGKYEFVLSRGQELYDRLREHIHNPSFALDAGAGAAVTLKCGCGSEINSLYRFCPWCGSRM